LVASSTCSERRRPPNLTEGKEGGSCRKREPKLRCALLINPRTDSSFHYTSDRICPNLMKVPFILLHRKHSPTTIHHHWSSNAFCKCNCYVNQGHVSSWNNVNIRSELFHTLHTWLAHNWCCGWKVLFLIADSRLVWYLTGYLFLSDILWLWRIFIL